jgi:uncharacterized phage-associated protein
LPSVGGPPTKIGKVRRVSADERKLEELILHIADRLSEQGAAGATKLNKLLFFCDFVHVREYGRPITAVEYQRLRQGPAPRRLLPVRDRLVARGDAEIRKEHYVGRVQDRLLALRPADLAVFDSDERSTIERVLSELGHLNGAELSALSHEEPGWRLVEDHETIPYSAAFLRRAAPGPRTREMAARLLADLPRDIADRR